MRLTSGWRQLSPPHMLGHLVDESSARVRVIQPQLSQLTSESLPNRSALKFHELTNIGKSPNPGMARLPPALATKISALTKKTVPQLLRQRVATIYQELAQGSAYKPALTAEDVDVQIQGLFLHDYASIVHTLREIKHRRPDFRPKSVLSVGFGPATGLLAFREVFGHSSDHSEPAENLSFASYDDKMVWETEAAVETETIGETARETENESSEMGNENNPTETAVIFGHPRMTIRAKNLLGSAENVRFRYEVPSKASPQRFDLIIASHQLYQTGKFSTELADSHAQQLAHLSSSRGIVLFVERGDPLGFEATAIARDHLLRPKYKFSVLGPCSHTHKCPLQLGLVNREKAANAGQQNWCRFTQNVERPRFTTELKKGQYLAQSWVPGRSKGLGGDSLKGSGRTGMANTEPVSFSYVALEQGQPSTAGQSNDWPRILKPPYKRQRHAIMEVCTPSGQIEQWTVPKSQGRQEYHDVRKASAGDLWALDAKVKQPRGGLRNVDTWMAKAAKQAKALPTVKEACVDWWLPKSNPHYKFGSHQARKRAENMMEPFDDSFLTAVDALGPESREEKVTKREIQNRYR